MKKNRMKRQSGFTLVELSIVLVAVSILMTTYYSLLIDKALNSEATAVKSRVVYIVEQLQRFYMDKIVSGVSPNDIAAYPATLSELETVGGYIEPCDPADVIAGNCYDYKYLPFGGQDNGEEIILTRQVDASGYPEFTLTFSLKDIVDDRKYLKLKDQLSRIPSFTIDASDNVTLRYSRPANAIHFQNLVPRDGSEKMTADWDYGGYDLNGVRFINEVENISVKGMNDRTLVSGLSRTGVIAVRTSTGEPIPKPMCPDGYTPQIAVWSGGVGVTNILYSPSNEAVWANVGTASHWTVFYKVNTATSSTDSKRKWSYEGIVGYSTSCG